MLYPKIAEARPHTVSADGLFFSGETLCNSSWWMGTLNLQNGARVRRRRLNYLVSNSLPALGRHRCASRLPFSTGCQGPGTSAVSGERSATRTLIFGIGLFRQIIRLGSICPPSDSFVVSSIPSIPAGRRGGGRPCGASARAGERGGRAIQGRGGGASGARAG